MLKRTLWSALLGLTCLATASELNTAPESLKIDVGADFRLRFDVQSDEIKSPTGNHKYGPHPSQYFDLRSRVWVKVQDKDSGLEAKLRLANRSKYYTSDWDAKNNYTTGNWSFPDEVFVDEAYLRFTKLGVQGLTLTFGRQNLQLGNGMVIYDGTNTDSSRSTYFDGIVAKYATENNTLHAFAFYDSWNDPIAIPLRWDKEDYPSGDGRALRPGDTLTLGLYNTHVFNDTFSLDTYYIYSDVQADAHGHHVGGLGVAQVLSDLVEGDLLQAAVVAGGLRVDHGTIDDHGAVGGDDVLIIAQRTLVHDQHDVGLRDDGALHLVGDSDVAHGAAAALLLPVEGHECHAEAGLDGGVTEALAQGDDALAADAGEQQFLLHVTCRPFPCP